MKVIIPVAGAGTRLRPHTYSKPKPLLRVGGRPILAHILDPVAKLKPDEVILVTGYLGDQIKEFVNKNYEFTARFAHQEELLGLGYALNLGLEDDIDDDVLIVLGDTIVDCDLRKFVGAGKNVLGLRKVDDPKRFGIATIEGDRVTGLEEKPEEPKTDLALIGLYYFSDGKLLKQALEDHVKSGKTTRGEIQFTDAIQGLIDRGETVTPYVVDEWFDCGKKETMLETNRYFAAKEGVKSLDGCVVIPPVYVHPDATVTNSVIGPNVSISERTVVRNSVVRECIIGADCTIVNMVLDDSLIGDYVALEKRAYSVNLGDTSSTEVKE